MAKNLIAKYIWIVDTIERHGAITRERLSELWSQSDFSNGEPLPRRSFYNYRNGIADTLGIDIECNPATYEYYIAHDGTENGVAEKFEAFVVDAFPFLARHNTLVHECLLVIADMVRIKTEHLM